MNTDDCQDCQKLKQGRKCMEPCLYIELITKLAGKHKSIRERLAPPDITDDKIHQRDYKNLLNEMSKAKESLNIYNISDVRAIDSIQRRAVVAMLYAQISQHDIAHIMDITVRHLRRIINENK